MLPITTINEGKKADKKNLIFLSARAAKKCADTSLDIFEKHATERGYGFYCLNPEFTTIDDCRDNEYVFTLTDASSNAEVVCDIRNTIIIPRRSAITTRASCDLLKLLKFHGFFLVNTLDVFLTCEDKFETYRVLSNAHIATPDTILCPKKNIQKALDKASEWGYPIVGKLPSGTQGIGVFIMDSPNSALSVLQAMSTTTDGVILQRFINSKCDYRVHVLNNSYSSLDPKYEVIGMMRRSHTKEDFRSNYHLGASVEIVNTENTDGATIQQIEDIAKAAAKAVGAVWCGVDVIMSEDNKFYVIEINSSPGTTGITSAGGTPVESIMSFFEKFEWIPDNNIAGCVETMDLVFSEDNRITCNMGLCTDDVCTIFYDSLRMVDSTDQAEVLIHGQKTPVYMNITGSNNKGAKTAYVNVSFNHVKYKYVPVILVSADDIKKAYKKDVINNEIPSDPMLKNGFELAGLMGSPFTSRANVCISADADHVITDV